MANSKDFKRMCESMESCETCILLKNGYCYQDSQRYTAKEKEIVDNWVKNNPVKSYIVDYLEKHPNVPRHANGIPCVCVNHAYPYGSKCRGLTCYDCWHQKMKD